MLFKLSNLNSKLALTLGYLNPALNNSALGLLLSISTNKIVACSNRAGSITLFSCCRFQTTDLKVLFDVAWDRILERFKLENLKYL